MKKSVLIVDDHPLFRQAFSTVVRSIIPTENLHEASSYQETHSRLNETEYDFVFLDLNMPDSNGLMDFALLKKLYPNIPIVIISAHEKPNIIRTCLRFNAAGYISKSSSPDAMRLAIKEILAGATYRPDWIDLHDETMEPWGSTGSGQVESLSSSQLKVLIEIGKGKMNKQIAEDLDISEATVKTH